MAAAPFIREGLLGAEPCIEGCWLRGDSSDLGPSRPAVPDEDICMDRVRVDDDGSDPLLSKLEVWVGLGRKRAASSVLIRGSGLEGIP